jgi:branched-chain amino acid aminotransferase
LCRELAQLLKKCFPLQILLCIMAHNISFEPTLASRIHEVDFNNIPFGRNFSDHMFIVDFDGTQWVNPRIVPFGTFMIHPANMALHYGQSIFEGMKASKNQEGLPCLLRPEMHARRLNASATRMCMPELPEELFVEGLKELLAIDSAWIPTVEGASLYIRPLMFATDDHVGVSVSQNYTFMIMTCPVGPYYTKPVRLLVEQHYVRAAIGGVGEAKTAGNYAASLLPAQLAKQKGYDQVMWMDAKEFKYIQEAGTMNLVFVIDGVVVTPATDGAILKGITLDTFKHILKSKNIPFEQRAITIDELVAAYEAGKLTEAFGAGTAAVVSHVSEITYNDLTMVLPPIENRTIGNMLYKEINGLRNGTIEDTYGWIVPIEKSSFVMA